jgi:hypothetical protein
MRSKTDPLLAKQDNSIHWVMENYGHSLEEAIADLREFGGL